MILQIKNLRRVQVSGCRVISQVAEFAVAGSAVISRLKELDNQSGWECRWGWSPFYLTLYDGWVLRVGISRGGVQKACTNRSCRRNKTLDLASRVVQHHLHSFLSVLCEPLKPTRLWGKAKYSPSLFERRVKNLWPSFICFRRIPQASLDCQRCSWPNKP